MNLGKSDMCEIPRDNIDVFRAAQMKIAQKKGMTYLQVPALLGKWRPFPGGRRACLQSENGANPLHP